MPKVKGNTDQHFQRECKSLRLEVINTNDRSILRIRNFMLTGSFTKYFKYLLKILYTEANVYSGRKNCYKYEVEEI